MSRVKHPTAWVWMIEEGLCYWAEPSKEALRRRSKPSPEAVPRMVRLVPEGDYRKLKKSLNRGVS